MKRFIRLDCLLVVILSTSACNFIGSETSIPEDSLQYYPPTPKVLDKALYRDLFRKTAAFFDTTLKNQQFNGSFLVAKNGAVIYEQYQGAIWLKGKDSISPSTPFHIASTSKTFTAMAILKLQEEGKLSIQDNVQQYFKAFPYKGITIEMLLNHRSGIPNYAYFLENVKWPKDKSVKNRDVLEVLCKNKPGLSFISNKRFGYSNTNYVLLALIIEHVSGKSYADHLQNVFFEPLKMEDTKVYSPQEADQVTPSYRKNGSIEPLTYLDETYGDKNIYSTVRDLLKWDQALYTQKLFAVSTLNAAFSPYSFEKPGMHNYGLGWRMYLLNNGEKVIYHNGWWHGNNASFYRVLSDSVTIIVLGNRYNEKIYQVKPLIETLTKIRFKVTEEASP